MLNKNLIEISGGPFIVDMMYAKPENMTGVAVYEKIGFGNKAFVHNDVYQKMQKLLPLLQAKKLKMKICDAYRPPVGHRLLKELIPMQGFFAENPEKSQHCHGTAIDVVLCDEKGKELDFPTLVDAYEEGLAKQVRNGDVKEFLQHLQKARQDYQGHDMNVQIANRQLLCRMMVEVGFEPLMHEWWHFNLPNGKDENHPMIEF